MPADAARPCVTRGNANQRAVTIATAVGYARRYLLALAPADDWSLLGTEHRIGNSGYRADVVWQHITYGWVLLDEVKTTQLVPPRPPEVWIEQAARYARAAHTEWGDLVVGVRLLPLALAASSVLPRAGARPQPISPTPEHPYAPSTGS